MTRAMLKTFSLLALLAISAFGADDDVRALLERQVADWNRGDVRAFVSAYAEDTVFVSDQVTRGAAQLLERYIKRYPNKDAMGALTFSDLEIRPLGGSHA